MMNMIWKVFFKLILLLIWYFIDLREASTIEVIKGC